MKVKVYKINLNYLKESKELPIIDMEENKIDNFLDIIKRHSNNKDTNILFKDEETKLETSIWYDYINEDIQNGYYAFLLAKDTNKVMIESDEEIKKAERSNDNKPKIPSHCVYVKNDNLLLMEDSVSSAGILLLQKGLKKALKSNYKLSFSTKNHENYIEDAFKFVNYLSEVKISAKDISKYIKKDDESFMYDLLSANEFSLNGSLSLSKRSKEFKEKVLNYFKFMSQKEKKERKIIENITIKYNSEEKERFLSLKEKLFELTIKINEYDDNIFKNDDDRLKYSTKVYQEIIKGFEVYGYDSEN